MMVALNDATNREIQSLFKENITLEPIGVSGNETIYRLLTIDGEQVKESIYIQYFKEKGFLNDEPMSHRGTLLLYSYGEHSKDELPKHSFIKCVKNGGSEALHINDVKQHLFH